MIGGSEKKTLVLMRHAKSSWTSDVDDHQRPLSSRGRRDGRAAGAFLAARHIEPDLVLCSTAERARQTFDRTVSGGASFGDVVYSDDLYAAAPTTITKLVRETSDDVATLMVVGHCPGIGEAVGEFAHRRAARALLAEVEERFPTSAIVVIEFEGDWSELEASGRLVTYEVPRG